MIDDIVLPKEKLIYIRSEDCLVLSDIHLGCKYRDRPYPVMEHEEIHQRILKCIDMYHPSTIVFNGDIFTGASIDEYSEHMFNDISDKTDNLVFNLGNHERKRGGYPDFIQNSYEVGEYFEAGDYLIHHGDRTPTVVSEINIIGHIHPVSSGQDVLLYGEEAYFNTDIIITPKFSNILNGSSIEKSSPKGHCPILDDGHPLDDYVIAKKYN